VPAQPIPVDRVPLDRTPLDRAPVRVVRVPGVVRIEDDGVVAADRGGGIPRVTDRVPDHMPFVVRTSPLRFIGYVGGATLVAYVAYGWLLSTIVLVVAADTADNAATGGTAGLLGVVGFLLGVPAVVLQRRCFGHGPLLGADSDQICGRPIRRAGQRSAPVVWLAWSDIDSVYVGRRRLRRVVWVVPRGAPDARVAVPTRLADHQTDQILRVLRELSAGRVRVYSGWL
jgi:hypothetical protein